MTLDVQAIISDLKTKALPVLEKDLVVIVDSILGSIKAQSLAQPGDLVADIVGLALGALQPGIDAEMAKLMPASV